MAARPLGDAAGEDRKPPSVGVTGTSARRRPLVGRERPPTGCLVFLRFVRCAVGDELDEVFHVLGQILGGGQFVEREADRGQFAGQVLGVGLGAGGNQTVPLEVGAVAFVLPVLGEQDQRGRVGG